ncbi:MAG: ABC transporter permease [Deltaproteobacteria bacterium]|jgi:oligopeptide transport system permease protein|nr:ABC transporter permease [Deltaproteobacteria bacterium]MBW2537784.1 ABC transporter permease [Deltaproteobacteria bacterium]
MAAFLIKRLVWILVSLWLVATIVFFLLRLVPGGPFDSDRAVPADIQQALDAKYHLDDPVLTQYLDWLGGVVWRGDLGPTYRYAGRSVGEIIAASLPVSVELGVFALLFALAFGIPLGVLGAIRHNRWQDTLSMAVALVGISVPRFVLAPLLILVFSLTLYWLPVARWESWRHVILPVICAGLPMGAYVARLTRSGMLEVVRSDFIRTARAKGLTERRIILRHALRGGLLPVLSFLGPGVSGLLVGSLVIERIFDIPGMGRYFVEAATNRDYNLVMGVTLVYAALLMTFNAAVDVAYGLLDPRVKLE